MYEYTDYHYVLNSFFFFFNDTATTEIYTLSLHDALPILSPSQVLQINGRLCHLVLAFPYVGDIANGRATSLRGHYSASSLLRTQPPPSRLLPTSRFRLLYGLPCSDDFAPGRGGLLQLLSMSLSPCCRFHPAEVNIRIGQSSAAHAAFALRLKARPSGILIFEATMRSLLLRPGDSWPPPGRPCR